MFGFYIIVGIPPIFSYLLYIHTKKLYKPLDYKNFRVFLDPEPVPPIIEQDPEPTYPLSSVNKEVKELHERINYQPMLPTFYEYNDVLNLGEKKGVGFANQYYTIDSPTAEIAVNQAVKDYEKVHNQNIENMGVN